MNGYFTGEAELSFYTKVDPTKLDAVLDSNGGISFNNSAKLLWSGVTTLIAPTHTVNVTGIGAGGLVDKTGGAVSDFTFASPNTIRWTVTVNRNQITMPNAVVTDTIPSGQLLLIDATHPFEVRKVSDNSVVDTAPTTGATGGSSFTYSFPASITETYTITFYTEIVDVNPGSITDSAGLDTLYTNGSIPFQNQIKLTRTGEADATVTSTKTFNSQVLAKTRVGSYNYTENTAQWNITVNRNRMPLTNAVVTDTIPAVSGTQMTLVIDATHPFEVRKVSDNSLVAAAPTTGTTGDSSFTYAFGTAGDTESYTITFWTQLDEAQLQTQWNSKTFTNQAVLTADEISGSKTASATVSVRNPIVTKKYIYQSDTASLDWTVLINPAGVTLQDAYVTDVLNANLLLNASAVKLYRVAVNPSDPSQYIAASKVFVDPTDPANAGYTVDLATTANGNTLTVNLPHTSSDTYLLEFTTDVLNDLINITNQVTLTDTTTVGTPSATSSAVNVTNLWSSGVSGSNTLTVHKSETGDPSTAVQGAVFRLLNWNNTPIQTSAGADITATTDVGGDGVFSGLPSWVFYVEEISVPDGYLLPAVPAARIFGDGNRLSGSATISVTNAPAVADVSFSKTDLNSNPVSGGTFTLTGNDYDGNAVTMTSTSIGGTVTFAGVPLGGPYNISETVAPGGYYLSTDTLTATVAYTDGTKTALVVTVSDGLASSTIPGTIVMTNTPVPSISFGYIEIHKTDAAGNKLQDAKFVLYNSVGTAMITAVSNANGIARFSNVPFGTYTIRETAAPEGYLASGEEIAVTVSSPITYTFTVVNEEQPALLGGIAVIKTDEGGAPLSGAEFTLYDEAGVIIASAATGADGRVVFDNLPAGAYALSETKAPEGYSGNTNSMSVAVKAGEIQQLTVENSKTPAPAVTPAQTGSISIRKTDEDGAPLSGAEFTLYDAAGAIIVAQSSDSDGMVQFDGLAAGDYVIYETAAPDGYELFDQPLALTLSGTQQLRYSLKNVSLNEQEEDSGVLGWYDEEEPTPGGNLPKTGGISLSAWMLAGGLALLGAGAALKPPRRKGKRER